MKECCICKKEIEEEKEICEKCKEKELLKWKKRNKELTTVQIVLAIVIILIVVFIYREINCSNNNCSVQGFIYPGFIDTREIQAFNEQWTNYEGMQMGKSVKSMIGRLIGHANTYQDEFEKVIRVEFINENGIMEKIEYLNEEPIEEFIKKLNNLYYKIESNSNYVVEFDFDGEPIIRTIKIIAGGEI